MRVTYVCAACGSEDVMKDAWAVWDKDDQLWDIGSIQDHAYCNACDGETTIKEISAEPPDAAI